MSTVVPDAPSIKYHVRMNFICRKKDYTRPMTFVSSKQQDNADDDGDSDSDKEVS